MAQEAGVTPLEASQVHISEPDWVEYYQELVEQQDDKLPPELRQDAAFERLLKEYRRFHFSWVGTGEDLKHKPMDSASAVIALAHLHIFPPRSLRKDMPRNGKCYEPDLGDDHMWLTMEGRAWRIEAVESRTLFLDSFGEQRQIAVDHRGWPKYIDKALEALWAAWPRQESANDDAGHPARPDAGIHNEAEA